MYTFLISIPIAFIITAIALYIANYNKGVTLKTVILNILKLNDNVLLSFGMTCVLINLVVCVIVGVSSVGWLEPVDNTYKVTEITDYGRVCYNENNKHVSYIKGNPKPTVIPIDDGLQQMVHEKSDNHDYGNGWSFFMVGRDNCNDTLFINRKYFDKVRDYYKSK